MHETVESLGAKREKHNIAATQMHKATESVITYLPVCARIPCAFYVRGRSYDYFPARLLHYA